MHLGILRVEGQSLIVKRQGAGKIGLSNELLGARKKYRYVHTRT